MDLETFRKLAADRRVIPVTRKLLADGDTPVALYRKLAAGRPGTFLLESAENGRSWSRYSFVGVRSSATLTEHGGQAHWQGTPPVGVPADGDPLAALRATLETLHTRAPADGRPPGPGRPGVRGGRPGPRARERPRRAPSDVPSARRGCRREHPRSPRTRACGTMSPSVLLRHAHSNEEQAMAGSSHGHTPAAWTGVIIAFIGFCVAGAFMVMAQPVGFWAGMGLVILGGVVGGIMRMMGMGQPKSNHPVHQFTGDREPARAEG
ncbi:hypothetical protein SGRIM128S_03509 [Streptomyces griseomycini]